MEKVQTTPQLPAKKPLRWQRYGMLAACLALVCIAGFSGLFANVGSKDAAAPESASDNGAADIALFDQYAAESSKTGGDAFSGSADDMADGAGTAMESTQDNGAPAVSEEPTILVNGQAYPQSSTHVLLALNRSATDDQKQFFAANSIADGDIPSNVEDPENFMLYLLPNDCYEKAVSLLEEGSYFVTVDTVREGERPGLLVMVPLDS